MTARRRWHALVTLTVLALVVGSTTLARTAAAFTDHSTARAGVTLTLWHNSADPSAILKLYQRFQQKAGIKLNIVSIPADNFENTTTTKWATGSRPDILEYHGTASAMQTLNAANNMVNLSKESFVKRGGALYKNAGVLNGKVYAAIIGFPQVFGMYYNKLVFRKAGLKPPKSFTDLFADCSTLKRKLPAVAPIYEAEGSAWPVQILPAFYWSQYNKGGALQKAILSRKTTLDASSSPYLKGIANYHDLQSKGCFNKDIITAKFETSMTALLSGKAAMVAQHSDMIPVLDQDANGNTKKVDNTIGFVGVSATKPVVWYAPSPLGTYYVPKSGNSDREKAALQFVRYITGAGYPQYVADAKSFPVLKGVPTPKGIQGLAKDVYKAYKHGGVAGMDLPGTGNFPTALGQMIAGQLTPQQVAQEVQQSLTQAAKAAGYPGW